VLNGIVLIGYFNQLKEEGMENIMDRIKEGTTTRLRPVIMTAAVASLGFLPMALSTSAGAEVQKPLATVVIGGLLTATLLTLIVLPVLYYLFERGVKREPVKAIVIQAILAMLFCSNLQAQNFTPLTLPQAIETALKNNGQLQASELDIKLQTQLKGTANEMLKTDFNVMLGQYNTKAFDQNYSISQTFNPFIIGAKKQLLTENVTTSLLNLKRSRQEITYHIRQSWNSASYLLALNKALQKQDSLLQGLVKSATLKLKTGESNVVEKITAEIKQQELLQVIKQNDIGIANETIKIQTMMGTKDAPGFDVVSFIPAANFSLHDTSLIKNNLQLEAVLQKVNVATANKKVEQSALKPDISVGYFLQSLTGKQEVNNQTKNYNGTPRFQGATLGLSLPIFATAQKARIAAAETNIAVQQQNATYLQTQLQSQLQQQVKELEGYQSIMDYYTQTALPNAQTIVAKIAKGYQSGDIGYVEYLQGLQTALDIQKNYLQAVNNYNQASINTLYLTNK